MICLKYELDIFSGGVGVQVWFSFFGIPKCRDLPTADYFFQQIFSKILLIFVMLKIAFYFEILTNFRTKNNFSSDFEKNR